MTDQPTALRLADALEDAWIGLEIDEVDREAATELRRLHQHELANNLWQEKTEWVQKTAYPKELGMHRADVLKQRIKRLHEENRKLKTVMIAAAEEIDKHWEAHCDNEGYGPVNLMNRLERGIATEYGYTAGRFLQLESQNRELFECLKEVVVAADGGGWSVLDPGLKRARAAIAKCERT